MSVEETSQHPRCSSFYRKLFPFPEVEERSSSSKESTPKEVTEPEVTKPEPEPEAEPEPEVEEEEVLHYIDDSVVVFRRQAGQSVKVFIYFFKDLALDVIADWICEIYC